MKKILFIIFILLCIGLVSAFTPQDDIDLRNHYQIINGTNISATTFLQDGNAVLDNTTTINDANYSTYANSSTYWGDYHTASDLNDLVTIQGENITGGTIDFARLPTLTNMLTLDWANITNKFITAVDDIYIYMSGTTATLNETKLNETIDARSDFDTRWSVDGTWIYNSSGDLSFNTTSGDARYLLSTNEGDLNVNHSNSTDYWGIFNLASDLDYYILSYWQNITGRPTHLSNFTDDLGDRGYTVLSNFTDDLGDRGYTVLSNFTDDLGDRGYDSLSNFTNNIDLINSTYGNATYILQSEEGNLNVNHSTTSGTATTWDGETSQADLNVNSSDYWDDLNTPSDIGTGDLTDDGTWRLESWDNFTGIPTATPSDGDTSNLSTADQIRDYVIGLGYSTTTGTVTSVATTAPITGGAITGTGTISLIACNNAEGYVYNSTSGAYECTALGSGAGSVTSVATDDTYLTGGPITGSGTITLNESVLNATIEAYGYSTTVGTVTSVATDDTYLTGGAITTTGTITFSTALAGTDLAVNSSDYWDNLGSPSDINAADITNDGTYRLENWDNFTGIPTNTPVNGDTSNLSTSNQIYDWVIGLSYFDSITDFTGTLTDAKFCTYDGTSGEINCTSSSSGGDLWSDLVDSSIIPDTDNTYDLGNSTHEFKDAFFDGTVTTDALSCSGAMTSTSLDTGQGAYELYAMNQDVESTDAVTFDNATISTQLTTETLLFEGNTTDINITSNSTALILTAGVNQIILNIG